MKISSVTYYSDGSIHAIGKLKDGKREGYWKWYRRDATKLKTGYFVAGKLAKPWMKYDTKGKLIHEI